MELACVRREAALDCSLRSDSDSDFRFSLCAQLIRCPPTNEDTNSIGSGNRFDTRTPRRRLRSLSLRRVLWAPDPLGAGERPITVTYPRSCCSLSSSMWLRCGRRADLQSHVWQQQHRRSRGASRSAWSAGSRRRTRTPLSMWRLSGSDAQAGPGVRLGSGASRPCRPRGRHVAAALTPLQRSRAMRGARVRARYLRLPGPDLLPSGIAADGESVRASAQQQTR